MTTHRTLVVSGTGFIGAWVVRCLVAAGHHVTVYHRGRHEPDLPRDVVHVRSPRASVPVLFFEGAVRRPTFDAVILMVPLGAADAQAAIEAFRGRAGRLIALSSGDVYAAYGRLLGHTQGANAAAAGKDAPLTEDSDVRESLYVHGRSAETAYGTIVDYEKLLVEQIVLHAGNDLPGIVLRLPKVYGPGDSRRWFDDWLLQMDEGRERIMLGAKHARWRWSHGYVEDVAFGVAKAVSSAVLTPRVYNLGERQTPTTLERVRAIGVVAGWAGDVRVVPEESLPDYVRGPLSYDESLVMDSSRARAELGYVETVSETAALSRTVDWLRRTRAEKAQPDRRPRQG